MSDSHPGYDIHVPTLKKVFSHFSNITGAPFPPRDYFVLDTETTGLNCFEDRIVQAGLLVVADGKPVSSTSILVKTEPERLTKEVVAIHGITPERLELEGIPPKEAFSEIAFKLNMARDAGLMFVSHNGVFFDFPFLEIECRRNGIPFKFGENEMIDTGMLVKGARLAMPPIKEMSLKSYFHMADAQHVRGVFFSLHRYCFDRFGLEKRGGSLEGAHDAGHDTRLIHLVLESMREMVESHREDVRAPDCKF